MSNTAKLYRKMEEELENFFEELKKKTPEEIISASYEKVMKEDFLLLFGEEEIFTEEQAKKLLENDKPLDFIYNEWLCSDYGYMDILRDFSREQIAGRL